MKKDVCPDRDVLSSHLLGKLQGAMAEIADEHLANCQSCLRIVREIDADDDLTQAFRAAKPQLEGDKEDVAEVIKRCKLLRSQAETVETNETIVTDWSSHSDNAHVVSTDSHETSFDDEIDFLADAEQPDEIGRLGGYRVLEVLGIGGMGVVFRAEDPKLERQVALKAMKPAIAASRSAKERFIREARATAAIEHDNIVSIYQVDEDRSIPFIAMKFLRGESLQNRLGREQQLDPSEVLRIGRQTATGLAAAHERKLIHRDIKPDNIWLEEETGRVKIVDFGLVRTTTDDVGLTHSGMVVGTPRYMSPEQAQGLPVDHRCDLFSLGGVLYHLATGKPPFEGGNVTATLVAVVRNDPEPVQSLCPDINPEMADMIMRLLSKDPDQRPQSAAEVATAIANIEQGLAEEAAREKQQQPAEMLRLPKPAAVRTLPKPQSKPQPQFRNPIFIGGTVVALVLAVFFCLWAAGIILKVKTEDGTLVVNIAGDDFATSVQGKTVTIQNIRTNDKYTIQLDSPQQTKKLKPGDYKFLLETDSGLTTKINRFTIASGKNERVDVWWEPGPPPTIPTVADRANRILSRAAWREYARKIKLAQTQWDGGNTKSARDTLSSCRRDLRGWEHDYLYTKFTSATPGKETFTIKGHTSRVTCVAFSSEGTRIVSGSWDKTVKVWDARTGEVLLTLEGHTRSVQGVAFSLDGKQIVSGSTDKTIKVWSTESGKETLTLKGHTGGVTSVAFSPDGKQIISGSDDKTIRVWNASSGEETLTLKGHTRQVQCVAFSPDGEQIVSGSRDNTIKVWSATSGEEIYTLKGHTNFVQGVGFSPDGKQIVSGSVDKTIKVWSAEKREETITLKGHTDQVTGLAFSPDGKQIVSGSRDNTIKVWSAASGQETLTLKGHTTFIRAAFSPNGQQIVSCADHTIKVWDASRREPGSPTAAPTLANRAKPIAPKAAWGEYARNIKLAQTQWDSGDTMSARNTLSSCRWDLRGWEHDYLYTKFTSATAGKETRTLKGHTSRVTCVAFSPNGMQIVSGSKDRTVRIWDAKTGEAILTLKGHTHSVYSVGFSPDGKQIVSGSTDKTIKVWNAESGEEKLTLKGHTRTPESVAFSPDGKQIVSGSYDKTIKIWNATSGEETLTLYGHTKGINSVGFSPDGTQIVSGSVDKTIRVWDAISGEETLTLKGHTDNVNTVAFSPDGKQIVSGSSDKTIKVWDAASGQEKLTLKGHSGRVTGVSFSPDGQQIVSGSFDETIKVWDATSGQYTITLNGYSGSLFKVAFSPDGKQIVSGSYDKTIMLWSASRREETFAPVPILEEE